MFVIVKRMSALMVAPALVLALSHGAVAHAEAPVAVPPEAPATVAAGHDRVMRLTVPVTIGEAGPYQFVVDTGADRTVVSRQLADRLNLSPGESATLHSMTKVELVRTVVVPTLGLGGRNTHNINAPALDEEDLGASGLLGIDSLKGRRIVMDFGARTLTIAEPGTREPTDPDTIVVTARSRFGQLVLVDASVDGVPITVIIDTGAQNTIGNSALRAMLGRKQRHLDFFPTTLLDVTGGTLKAEIASVQRVTVGGITLNDMVIAFADAHPFHRFGIDKKPAMLLGMDTLRAFRRVSVDFQARKVRFSLPNAG